MRLFATRVWGFDPATWPVVTFGLDGNRDNLLKKSNVGDAVVFVGTQEEPTDEADRGRLLGVAQFGRRAVKTEDVIDLAKVGPENFDLHGNFKWPSALLMTRAWRFTDEPRPLLLDVLSAQLPFNATTQAVELSESDAAAVKALAAEEVPLPASEALDSLRTLEAALAHGKPTTGPVPSAWRSMVVRSLGHPSVTYALRFGHHNCWKIGWAKGDAQHRLVEINKHVPVEAIGEEWSLVLVQKWSDEDMASSMEQRVLGALAPYRSIGERVQCSQAILESAWRRAIAGNAN